jgi:hypothetical protein
VWASSRRRNSSGRDTFPPLSSLIYHATISLRPLRQARHLTTGSGRP